MTKKKSAIPNASEMRKIVRDGVKKHRPDYKKMTSKLMDALKVSPEDKNPTSSQNMMKKIRSNKARREAKNNKPDTPDKSTGVMRREAPKKVKDPAVVKSARRALEGKTAAPKETYGKGWNKPIDIESKSKSKPKPKTKRKSLKESYAGKSEESMDPNKVESQVGTYSDKPIINDTREVVDPSEKQRLDQAEHKMKEAEKSSPNLWAGLAPLAMGAIMGDIGVGASVGGQMLIDQELRAYDMDAKRELASSKAAISGGSKTPHAVMENGKPVWRYGKSDIEGAQKAYSSSDLDKLRSVQEIKRESDVTKADILGTGKTFGTNQLGQDVLKDRRTGTQTLLNSKPMSPFHAKMGERAAVKFNQATEPLTASIGDLQSGMKTLASNNQLGHKMSVMRLVKEIESRLSDYDRLYYTQETADVASLDERARLVTGNEMNPRLQKDAFALIGRMIKKSKKLYDTRRKTHGSQLSGREFPKGKVDQVLGDRPHFGSTVKMYGNGGAVDVPYDGIQEAFKDGFQIRRANEE